VTHLFWLASYPKSGNTWFRAFLANLLHPSEQAARINDLNTGVIASARTPFDDIAGVEASDLTDDEIDRIRPQVFRQLADEADGPQYVKIHDAYARTAAGHLPVPPEATAGAIYFIRNPLDVAVSFAHHTGRDVAQAIAWMGDEHNCVASGHGQLNRQLRQRLLTWSGHVRSWVDQEDFPVCVVRYEDMHRDTEATFVRAVRFAGLSADPAAVARAIEFSSFQELRRQEQTDGFNERSPVAEWFFRKGVVGSWREALDDAQVARLVADHGDVMRRFGYLDTAGTPVF